MKNLELEIVPTWRFCSIPYGEKGPRYDKWQKRPFQIADIPDTANVGLLLGPTSGGVVAMDFDGASAWRFYDETFGIPITETVTWSSGRTGRCQMLYRVPEQYWGHLKPKKIALDQIPDTEPAKYEGFELRWDSLQSVMPPSRHPETGQDYFWVLPPSQTNVAELPDAVLAWWLLESNPVHYQVDRPERPPATDQQVSEALDQLKQLYPELDYDTWTRVTWAVYNTVGSSAGIDLMRYYYPETERGEYDRLRSEPRGRPVTMGTVWHLIQERRGHVVREQQKLIAELNQIDRAIQRRKAQLNVN